jgi:hypothetical protein
MKTVRSALLTAAFLAGISPASAQSVAVSADTLARAETAFAQLQSGKIDRGTLTPALSADLTDDVRAGMTRRLNAIGQLGPFAALSHVDIDAVTTTVFRIPSPSGSIDFTFGLDDATGKIAKLYFVPGPSV